MVFSNRCGETERSKVVQLLFSDGTTQNVTLANDCNEAIYQLEQSVSSLNIPRSTSSLVSSRAS
jgi:hypothetical protein